MAIVSTRMINVIFGPRLCSCF